MGKAIARDAANGTAPLDRIGAMLDEMSMLVRDAALAQPLLYPSEVEHPDVAELGLVDATIRIRHQRLKHMPAGWFSDPAWEILLFLFKSHLEDSQVTVGDVGHGTGNRPTTAIRWLEIIEAADFLERRRCTKDSRRVFVRLSRTGVMTMRQYFVAIRSAPPPFNS